MRSRSKTQPSVTGVSPSRTAQTERGAELLELALVLPLLLVMLVGIIDFGQAWVLKDKLAGAAREAARVAVADFNDTTNPQCPAATPCSVQAAASAAITALNNANVNTCGLDPSTTLPAAGTFTWTYTSTCTNPLKIEIERAVPQIVDGTTSLCTRVTITYAYNWGFASVVGLMGNPSTSSTITLKGVELMANLN